MKKNTKLEAFVSDAGKTARNLIDKSKDFAIRTVDQNNDGKLDLSDVSAIAGAMGDAVKRGKQSIKENAEDKARKNELKALQPFFPDSLDNADFLMPKFIRVTDRDKKHAESAVCQGSIGFISDQKGFRVVNIFKDSLDIFGLTFYPDCDCEFYYVDPSDRDCYIALNDYFGYLKTARIIELQKIAQDLGAKHFRVTYKEEQSSSSSKKALAHAEAATTASAKHESESTATKYSTVEIAADMAFPGHAPIKPQLKYMQREPVIQNLISMRMDEKAPLLHQKLMLKLSNSSGIKESDAVKIDTVLKGMKCSGNASIAIEAQNESRRYLEYEIEF